MTIPVVLRASAQEEADWAALWYEARGRGLGVDFLTELQRIFDVIAAQPDFYPLALGDTREAPLNRFPYYVYYRERPGRIVVTAVFHTSRDPSDWQRRV